MLPRVWISHKNECINMVVCRISMSTSIKCVFFFILLFLDKINLNESVFYLLLLGKNYGEGKHKEEAEAAAAAAENWIIKCKT